MVGLVTAEVATAKVADVAPCAIARGEVTVATAVLWLFTHTEMPPMGTAPLRVSVAVEELPPITLEGFNVIKLSVREEEGGVVVVGETVKVTDSVTSFDEAVMAICVDVETAVVEILNV